jgi:AcrR family transcriptional regulator
VRLLLQEAALELYLERGYDKTTAGDIAARAGFTERTFFRHFADKREVFFGGEAQLRDLLTGAVAAVPAGTRPLPALRAAFHQAVPLIERNLPVTERRMPVIVATPALKERALAKSAALVAALPDALQARGARGPVRPGGHGHLLDRHPPVVDRPYRRPAHPPRPGLHRSAALRERPEVNGQGIAWTGIDL